MIKRLGKIDLSVRMMASDKDEDAKSDSWLMLRLPSELSWICEVCLDRHPLDQKVEKIPTALFRPFILKGKNCLFLSLVLLMLTFFVAARVFLPETRDRSHHLQRKMRQAFLRSFADLVLQRESGFSARCASSQDVLA